MLRAHNGSIVDANGGRVLLRGVGLGNWLLPEGYMWKFEPPGPQSPREIEALIADLVGPAKAEEFWRSYRRRFITRDDIARIAAEGMNHVRLPINWRVLTEPDGLGLVDRVIDWCREFGLWIVLDLHGAPGGQTGTNIDDSLGTPALFEDPANRDLTIRLWREMAQRYRDEPVVAAYDLLNEPLPDEHQYRYAEDLVSLYRDLTTAIREVDPHHLIMYEGMHWATNWSIFTEVWDPNSALQFHKYWSPPDLPSIQQFIDVGKRLGLPIYMGEGGENNLGWLQTAFQLYEDHDIGWNFWPWKKIDTLTSPCSIDPPDGWKAIVDYAAGKAERPTSAEGVLWELLERMDISRCTYRSEVVRAIMRRVPLTIPATGFTFRGPGVSYQTSAAVALPGFRSDDQVTITGEPDFTHSDGTPGHELLVRLEAGDWVAYEFTTQSPHPAEVRNRRCRASGAPHAMPHHRVEVDVNADKPVSVAVQGTTVRVTATESGTHLASLEIR